MTPEQPDRFEAPLELMPWGRNTYTVIKIPEELAVRARVASTRRVEGTVNGVPVNVGLNRSDVTPNTFVYVGRGLQQRLGVSAGDLVECVLTPADPDHVPVPADVLAALEDAGRRTPFERTSAPEKRRLLALIEGAVRPTPRARRISALVESLPPD